MENNEMDKRLDELWKKASGKDYVPDPAVPSSYCSEAHVETVQFLKNNFSKAENDWKRLLGVKDSNIRELSAQLDETRAHLAEIKQYYQEANEKIINEELALQLNLEESGKMLDLQKKSHAREIAILKEILERTKVELDGMTAQLDALRSERDEWRKKSTMSAVEQSNLKDAAAGLESKLADAKEAVERTLSELLSERRSLAEAGNKIRESEKRNAELESQLANAKANWEAERKEWRELWDRERSVWETHRQEFAVWESRLRSEREAWSARLKEEEAKGLDYAAGLANTLKESSQWSEKVAQILKLYALKGVQVPGVFAGVSSGPSAGNGGVPVRLWYRSVTRVAAVALAGLILLGGFAAWMYDHRSKVHFSLLSSHALDAQGAAGISVSKDGLWLADWDTGLVLKDQKDMATLRTLKGAAGEPFRPAAVSAFDGGVWVLDMAQLKFIKKELADGKTLESVKTPGPAPQGAAWDGYNLWSFDAATGLVYRYGLDPAAGVEASFEVPGLKTLASMQWAGSELWTLDPGNVLRRHILKNGRFSVISEQKMKRPVTAFCAAGDEFWALEKTGNLGTLEVKKYKIKTF